VNVDTRKVGLLAAVYAGQAVAQGFATFAVPVLLRKQGVSIQAVGFANLLLLPMALKFVFGPWADRLQAKGKGAMWMSGLQLAAAACFAALVVSPLSHGILPFVSLVAAAYLLVAVLDVFTDGLAVRLLSVEERPIGNTAQYGGSYVGGILAGGLFLAAEPKLGWGAATSALALLIAAAWVALRALPSVPPEQLAATSEKASLLAFFRGPVARHVLPLLLLLDFPQNVGIALVGPFLIDSGLTQAQVGLVSGTVGLTAAVAGALAGGLLLARLSRVMALVAAGALQAVPLIGLAWLASGHITLPLAFAVVGVAYFFASVFNIALSSWFMDLASPKQPATDYSVMACTDFATFAVAGPLAGALASALGFGGYFLVCGVAALVLLGLALPWLRVVSRLGASAAKPVAPPPGAVAVAD
jgi:MFS family permease